MRLSRLFTLIAAAILASGCGEHAAPSGGPTEPTVKAFALSGGGGRRSELTGTLRAPVESPLAFQVGGRIVARLVSAGQSVAAGQPLFELDKRDLEQMLHTAEADLAAAKAALATAEVDFARNQSLHTKNFISTQALERFSLLRQEAKARWESAAARHQQALNTVAYGRLQSPADGVLIDVIGEPGQVVYAGQTVALLAQSKAREIEVYLPEGMTPPANGELMTENTPAQAIKLREVAGALDPQGRTRRARYTILGATDTMVLGSIARVRFDGAPGGADTFSVPIGALSERGKGASIWRIHDGHVASVPVSIVAVDKDQVRIRGPLQAGEAIVALGTHLLTENMAVRVAGQ